MPTLADLPPYFLRGLAVSLGLIFGSFLNVVIHRLPRDENLATPGSRCPGCGKPIAAYDNIPILSWMMLRGRARCCGTKISIRYPLIELMGGMLAWVVLQQLVMVLPGSTPGWRVLVVFAVYMALGLGLLAAAFIDLEHMILPDEITLGGTALGILTVPLRGMGWKESIVGAGVGFLVVWLPFDFLYRLLRGQPGMGQGDAKLTMLAGAWFGWPGAVFALLAGAVQGTIAALVVLAVKGRIDEPEAVKKERADVRKLLEGLTEEQRRSVEKEILEDPLALEPAAGIGKARLAFGPFLCIATLEYLFYGNLLMGEYLWFLWNA